MAVPLIARAQPLLHTYTRRRPEATALYEVVRDNLETLSYWHEQHTPLALRIHPLWRYSRCVVRRALTPDAPTYEGIVELQFREIEDITVPLRLFGDVKNVRVIQRDVANFIDMATISVTLVEAVTIATSFMRQLHLGRLSTSMQKYARAAGPQAADASALRLLALLTHARRRPGQRPSPSPCVRTIWLDMSPALHSHATRSARSSSHAWPHASRAAIA